jgi:phosphoribosylamine--glycine ligase
VPLTIDPRAAVGVVLASEGYPQKPVTGDEIRGLEGEWPAGVQVFHAGTRRDPAGRVVSAGGRVLTVCALGDGLAEAAGRAYGALARIAFRGMQYRRDIGASA